MTQEKLSQAERILNWLLTGQSINFYQCLEQIGSNNIKGRAFDIEEYARQGRKPFDIILKHPHSDPKHPIEREMRTLPNGKKVMVYWLNPIPKTELKQMILL